MQKNRDSNMELLRIVSMFCIVVYHIFIFGLNQCNPDEWLYKALQIPFHIGVPIFVMISGYFGIRVSMKGLFRLLGMAYVYAFLIEGLAVTVFNYPFENFTKGIFVIGNNRHWFLTTYLWLYLLSPFINKFMKGITGAQRIYLLAILAFMVFYSGNLKHSDPSLEGGKNITNFMFLYVLGNTVHTFQDKVNNIRWAYLMTAYVALLLVSVVTCYFHPDYQLPLVGNLWQKLYPYDSIGLYLMVILVFLIFSKIRFQSDIVNNISKGVFSMYLISISFIWEYIRQTSVDIEAYCKNPLLTIFACCGLAFAFMIFSVGIDKMLSPVWRLLQNAGAKLDKKYNIPQHLSL